MRLATALLAVAEAGLAHDTAVSVAEVVAGPFPRLDLALDASGTLELLTGQRREAPVEAAAALTHQPRSLNDLLRQGLDVRRGGRRCSLGPPAEMVLDRAAQQLRLRVPLRCPAEGPWEFAGPLFTEGPTRHLASVRVVRPGPPAVCGRRVFLGGRRDRVPVPAPDPAVAPCRPLATASGGPESGPWRGWVAGILALGALAAVALWLGGRRRQPSTVRGRRDR